MHNIRRQILEIKTVSGAAAASLQREAPKVWRENMEPILSELLDRLASPQDHIRIDRVEIDLGAVSSVDSDAILSRFRVRAAHALYEKMAAGKADAADTGPAPVLRLTPAQLVAERMTYFLVTGHLPWWSENLTQTELEKEFLSWLHRPDFPKTWFFTAINTYAVIRRRLIFQFSDEALVETGSVLAGDDGRRASSLVSILHRNLSGRALPANVRRPARDDIWAAFFAALAADPDPSSHASLTARTVRALASSLAAAEPDLGGVLIQAVGDLPFREADTLRSVLGESPHASATTAVHPAPSVSETDTTEPEPQPSDAEPAANGAAPADTAQTEAATAATSLDLSGALAVDGAGLSLLCPFLPAYLKSVDSLPNATDTSEGEIRRRIHAALLLQFLITGQPGSHPEHRLVLPKLLAGLPLDTPVPARIAVSDHEKTETDFLLRAIIDHWTALKSTSIAGLRESFLVRPGFLTFSESTWTLRVEDRAHDVLLSTLPWSFSLIHFSWMPHPMRTVWHLR